MKIIQPNRKIEDENYLQKRTELIASFDLKMKKSNRLQKIFLYFKKHQALWRLSLDYNVYNTKHTYKIVQSTRLFL
jgi:hypothetical protein